MNAAVFPNILERYSFLPCFPKTGLRCWWDTVLRDRDRFIRSDLSGCLKSNQQTPDGALMAPEYCTSKGSLYGFLSFYFTTSPWWVPRRHLCHSSHALISVNSKSLGETTCYSHKLHLHPHTIPVSCWSSSIIWIALYTFKKYFGFFSPTQQ